MSKIMDATNLDDIVVRLKGCCALLNVMCECAGMSDISEEAIAGVLDLLEMICRDFRADIDAAEKVPREAVAA